MPAVNYVVAEKTAKDLQTYLRALDAASKVIQSVVQSSTGKFVVISHD